MDHLLSKLFPRAKCVGEPIEVDNSGHLENPHELEESQLGGGAGDFKAAQEFRMVGTRKMLFSVPEGDKIEGFKFSLMMPLHPTFIMQHSWKLYPPQAANPNPMFDMMMPPKSSHYELDVCYIHGGQDDMMAMPTPAEQAAMTMFRCSRKASGAIEAMVQKTLAKWLDFRFEGHFRNAQNGQWNIAFVQKSTFSSLRQVECQHPDPWKHQL